MRFEIKSRFSGAVLFAVETESLRLAVELAVKARANLAGAKLARANLAREYHSAIALVETHAELWTPAPAELTPAEPTEVQA